jgi:hypothetical protein
MPIDTVLVSRRYGRIGIEVGREHDHNPIRYGVLESNRFWLVQDVINRF